jgi:hypothetical protein
MMEDETRERKHAMMRSRKLHPLVMLADLDVADAPGDDDAEPLLELVDVPVAALSRVTRYISPVASEDKKIRP